MDALGGLRFYEGDRFTTISYQYSDYGNMQGQFYPLNVMFHESSLPDIGPDNNPQITNYVNHLCNYNFEEDLGITLDGLQYIGYDYGAKGYENREWQSKNKKQKLYDLRLFHFDPGNSYADINELYDEVTLYGNILFFDEDSNSWESIFNVTMSPEEDVNLLEKMNMEVDVHNENGSNLGDVKSIRFGNFIFDTSSGSIPESRFFLIRFTNGLYLKDAMDNPVAVKLSEAQPYYYPRVFGRGLGLYPIEMGARTMDYLLKNDNNDVLELLNGKFQVYDHQYGYQNWLNDNSQNPVSISGTWQKRFNVFDSNVTVKPLPYVFDGIPRITHTINELNYGTTSNPQTESSYTVFRDEENCREGYGTLSMVQGTVVGFVFNSQADQCYSVPIANSHFDCYYKGDTAYRVPVVDSDLDTVLVKDPWHYYFQLLNPVHSDDDPGNDLNGVRTILSPYNGQSNLFDHWHRFNLGGNHTADLIPTALNHGYSFIGFGEVGLPIKETGKSFWMETTSRMETQKALEHYFSTPGQTFDPNHIHATGGSGGGHGTWNVSISDSGRGGHVLPADLKFSSVMPRAFGTGLATEITFINNKFFLNSMTRAEFLEYSSFPGNRLHNMTWNETAIQSYEGAPNLIASVQDCPILNSRDYNLYSHFDGIGVDIDQFLFP